MEIQMNHVIAECEIMNKKQEIRHEQEEIRGMSESGSSETDTPRRPLPSIHQGETGHQLTMLGSFQQIRNLSERQGNTIDGIVSAHFLPQRQYIELKQQNQE